MEGIEVTHRTRADYTGRLQLAVCGSHDVYKAAIDGRECALKEFSLSDGHSQAQFKREVRSLSRLSHPNIVAINAVFFENNETMGVIEMPLYPHTLDTWVAGVKPLPVRLREAMRGLLRGIEYVHREGIVHRDIKVQNVFVAEDGRPVLGDFDISKSNDDRRMESTVSMTVAAFTAPSSCSCVALPSGGLR
eukprot:Opistho-2@32004